MFIDQTSWIFLAVDYHVLENGEPIISDTFFYATSDGNAFPKIIKERIGEMHSKPETDITIVRETHISAEDYKNAVGNYPAGYQS
jgi:hypothetical protein